ncbi:hypothetical protein Mgra_00004914 [Meloidogyne graminicola]|uniref:arginine--tRNA ligase n=1 Tax=Meloidogyne graminicola TaxID=189291 RepID=A0A8S9ZR13_9BILA|nr:hypothetical protein Mgra_00004914 [Meloidogyne graminicola]
MVQHQTIYAAAQKLGWYSANEKRVEHVQFGLVLGEDKKKFKTRSGETVKLLDLLNEGVRRAEEKLRLRETGGTCWWFAGEGSMLLRMGRGFESCPSFFNFESDEQLVKAAESLAYGCIKYADLSQSRIADYIFSFDRVYFFTINILNTLFLLMFACMLDDRGNTAVYLLYAYTRIWFIFNIFGSKFLSIARNANVDRTEINNYLGKLDGGVISLEHPREVRLAKQILKFSDCVLNTVTTLHISKVCDYIYELATLFHDFYKECYVISKTTGAKEVSKMQVISKVFGLKMKKINETEQVNINFNRLVLCEVVADVMQQCFSILGIRPIDRIVLIRQRMKLVSTPQSYNEKFIFIPIISLFRPLILTSSNLERTFSTSFPPSLRTNQRLYLQLNQCLKNYLCINNLKNLES